jgi:hypothetical protein
MQRGAPRPSRHQGCSRCGRASHAVSVRDRRHARFVLAAPRHGARRPGGRRVVGRCTCPSPTLGLGTVAPAPRHRDYQGNRDGRRDHRCDVLARDGLARFGSPPALRRGRAGRRCLALTDESAALREERRSPDTAASKSSPTILNRCAKPIGSSDPLEPLSRSRPPPSSTSRYRVWTKRPSRSVWKEWRSPRVLSRPACADACGHGYGVSSPA